MNTNQITKIKEAFTEEEIDTLEFFLLHGMNCFYETKIEPLKNTEEYFNGWQIKEWKKGQEITDRLTKILLGKEV